MSEEKVSVTLDFTECRYVMELYAEMRVKMEWEDFYGNNLDALWDILWGMPHKGNDFVIYRPRTYQNIPHGDNEGFTGYVNKICSIFERAQNHGYLTMKIIYTES